MPYGFKEETLLWIQDRRFTWRYVEEGSVESVDICKQGAVERQVADRDISTAKQSPPLGADLLHGVNGVRQQVPKTLVIRSPARHAAGHPDYGDAFAPFVRQGPPLFSDERCRADDSGTR